MANYISTVLSNSFKVKKEEIENVRRAINIFEESCVDNDGRTVIASYEYSLDDDYYVVIDTRTNKVIGTYNSGYQELEDCIEVNGSLIEEELANAHIKSEEEYDVEDFKEVPFYNYLQSVIDDTEKYILIKEIGHEKLRYTIAYGVCITKDAIKHFDIDTMALQFANKDN